MTLQSETIGFIGLGNMGYPMASRLRSAGYPVVAHDASPERLARFADETGAQPASSGMEVARQADLIITILPTSRIIGEVLQGENAVLAALRPGAVILEMSSGVPSETIAFAKATQAAGGMLLDAPVSGGVPRASTGDLTIMVGGDLESLERVRPVLGRMGKSVVHTGKVGTAHAMKALNNLVSAGGFLIGAEALLIGQRFGLEPQTMIDILNKSSGMNNSTQNKFAQFVLSRAFDSGFGLDLMVKDLGIALGLASEGRVPAPFSALCKEIWASAESVLGPGQDHTAVAKFCEGLARAELVSPSPEGLEPHP